MEARDVVLQNFLSQEQIEQQQDQEQRGEVGSKNADFVNAYLSTPQFINTLTDLSDEVMTFQSPEEKKAFLKRKLCEINRKLPA